MADQRERVVQDFFTDTGRSYDEVVNKFTLGQDRHWKKQITRLVPPSTRILDLGCGTGIMTEYLARAYPLAEIVGVDMTPDMLKTYRERLRGNPRITSILANAEKVKLDGEFDSIVSSYLAKYVDADALLSNVALSLRRGGVFIAHDFTYPANVLYRFLWSIYTDAMNLIGSATYPEWNKVFDQGLTRLIRETDWLNKFRSGLIDHGFREIEVKMLTFETAGIIWAKKS